MTMRLRLALALALLLAIGLTLRPAPAAAAGPVGTGTPASCTAAALTTALAGGGTVTFNCGAAPHTVALTAEQSITANTVIDGGGLITLSGGDATRLFSVQVGATLELRNLTLADGFVSDPNGGGAIWNAGTLILSGVTIRDSQATSAQVNGYGGAIANTGNLQIADSVFSGNIAGGAGLPGDFSGGGAIFNAGPTLVTIARTSFVNNQALPANASEGGALVSTGAISITESLFQQNSAREGGAVLDRGTQLTIAQSSVVSNTALLGSGVSASGSAATITNSTISGNTSTGANGGAVISNGTGTLAITHATIAGNSAGSGAGGVTAYRGAVTLRGTLLAGNGSANCAASPTGGGGTITSEGFNLDSAASCGLGGTGDLTNATANLGTLGSYGGRTPTRPLLTGSAAIDAGPTTALPATDQRGGLRATDGNGDGAARADIGAYEARNTPVLTSLSPANVDVGAAGFTLTLTGSNILPGARVLVGGVERAATIVNTTTARIEVAASELTAEGTIAVQIANPGPDDGVSATRTLAVVSSIQPRLYLPVISR